MFQTKVVEEIKTYFVFNNPPPFENYALYEIMWKNMVELYKSQMAIRGWSEKFSASTIDGNNIGKIFFLS